MDKPNTPLERAITASGGITKLARALGLKSHAVINNWREARVPADWCPDIEGLTGIRCEELRPDVNWGVLRLQCAAVEVRERRALGRRTTDTKGA
jgi:DNA-binding transcriptional regulator YdaS (Cro superfamily)